MSNYERIDYYEDDDIKVYLEKIDGLPFIHAGLYNVNKRVINKVREKWGEIIIGLYELGYDVVYTYTKDNRVINLIGGAEKVGDREGYEVYVWDLT